MKKTLLTVASVVCMCTILLTGCQNTPETTAKKEGSITLSVNPEIMVNYDENGAVTEIVGLNVDGQTITESYPDYIGKDCTTVISDLTGLIKDAGYFIEEIDGQKKNIVIQIEKGSYIPNGSFLSDLESAVTSKISEGSNVVTIDSDDYDDKYQNDNYISYEKAKEIALAQAHITSDGVVFEEREFDFDDGLAIYELEFTKDGVEYEYDIDALSGKVIKAHNSKEVQKDDTDYGPLNDGVTDYHDSDYGPDNDGVTDYGNTDYGPNNDGVTDYDDTDYGPLNDGVTDYDKTDYSEKNDVTDYKPQTQTQTKPQTQTQTKPQTQTQTKPQTSSKPQSSPSSNTNYSDYDSDSDYDPSSDYDDGNSDYDD